jgi:phage regulator Rha-like protein
MFQLTGIEVEMMVSQNAIPSKSHLGGALPFAFTEHGVLMLATVLKSEQAIQVSIRIIELFVKLREILLTNAELKYDIEKIKKKLDNQDKNMEIVFRYLDELIEKKEDSKPRTKIGYRLPKN